MNSLNNSIEISRDIRHLALKAMNRLSTAVPAYNVTKRRVLCPLDYMRYAEVEAIQRDLKIDPQMEILDVSGPQWFSLYLAERYPKTIIHYINIVDSEISPYQEIAKVLDIKNLNYHKADARELHFKSNSFDKVISISVIEHIFPEKNGDLRALSEIRRVLKSTGELLLTVPYKTKPNIVYKDGSVYERCERKRNFYAREYDKVTFEELIKRSGFIFKNVWHICERRGLFSVDYFEWGPGQNTIYAKFFIKLKKLVERKFQKALDEALAKRYLKISQKLNERIVNISATLVPA